jgi:hypothetical protein
MELNEVRNFEPFEESTHFIAQPGKIKQRADKNWYLFFGISTGI